LHKGWRVGMGARNIKELAQPIKYVSSSFFSKGRKKPRDKTYRFTKSCEFLKVVVLYAYICENVIEDIKMCVLVVFQHDDSCCI